MSNHLLCMYPNFASHRSTFSGVTFAPPFDGVGSPDQMLDTPQPHKFPRSEGLSLLGWIPRHLERE